MPILPTASRLANRSWSQSCNIGLKKRPQGLKDVKSLVVNQTIWQKRGSSTQIPEYIIHIQVWVKAGNLLSLPHMNAILDIHLQSPHCLVSIHFGRHMSNNQAVPSMYCLYIYRSMHIITHTHGFLLRGWIVNKWILHVLSIYLFFACFAVWFCYLYTLSSNYTVNQTYFPSSTHQAPNTHTHHTQTHITHKWLLSQFWASQMTLPSKDLFPAQVTDQQHLYETG